jgi:hypothetical protein
VPKAKEVAQEMDATKQTTDDYAPKRTNEEEEEERNEEKKTQTTKDRRFIAGLSMKKVGNWTKVEKSTAPMSTNNITSSKQPNSLTLEIAREQKRRSQDYREDYFLAQLRRVRLSAPQVRIVNWSDMAMSTYATRAHVTCSARTHAHTHAHAHAHAHALMCASAGCQIGTTTGLRSKRSRCTTTTSRPSR